MRARPSEAPNLQGMYRELKDKGLEVVAINEGDTPQNVAKFIEQYKLTFPVAMGGKPTDAKDCIFTRYGVDAYPTNYLIDATGKIVWHNVGYEQGELIDFDQLAKVGGEVVDGKLDSRRLLLDTRQPLTIMGGHPSRIERFRGCLSWEMFRPM